MYKNPKELLVAATSFPAAIEAKLPEGAPKISTMLVDTAGKMPDLPDFIVEIPDLPAVPEFPEMPGGELRRRRIVTGVEVTPVPARAPVARAPAVARRPEEEVVRIITP